MTTFLTDVMHHTKHGAIKIGPDTWVHKHPHGAANHGLAPDPVHVNQHCRRPGWSHEHRHGRDFGHAWDHHQH